MDFGADPDPRSGKAAQAESASGSLSYTVTFDRRSAYLHVLVTGENTRECGGYLEPAS
jgi:hypothetical protein